MHPERHARHEPEPLAASGTPAAGSRGHRRGWRRLLAVFVAVVLVAAACSSDDDSSSPTTTSGTSEATSTAGAGEQRPADVEVRLATFDAPDGPGPAEYDKINVLQHGPEDAPNVAVLVPGTSAGAAYFSPLARDIVAQRPGWQVWAVDRRENLLEDHSVLDQYLAGDVSNEKAFDYYLRWLTDSSITDHFEPPEDEAVGFARDWGMATAVEDLDAVVDEAAALGGEVVLGGHSLGGTITTAYASWDFDGQAGVDKLSGLVFIDGGSAAGGAPPVDEIRSELTELDGGAPFNDLVGLGLPWAAGVFNALGASAALLSPDEANLAYDWSAFPEELKPPVAPTNAGQYGYALDLDTSPENLDLVQMRIGELAPSGEPRGWVDDGPVPLERAATMFSGTQGIDGTAWYHPLRLSIDGGTVNGGIANPAQEVTGVRATHGEEIDVPIFALATTFGAGRVLEGARSLAEQSDLPDDQLTLVDESETLTHTDPMGIATEQNPLLEAIVPYLGDID